METQGMSITPESEGLDLPAGLALEQKIGAGKYNRVYKASFQGETLAVKAYSPRAIEYYRKKHRCNIAVYEMGQNRTFRKVPELVPYTAKPVRVIGQDGSGTLCFLQEFIDGITMAELLEQLGHLPGSLMAAGETIDRVCEEHDIPGVDQYMKNIRVREINGQWLPVLHDFKHVPLPRQKTAASTSLLSRIGLGRKGPNRNGFLGEWDRLG